MLVIHGCAGPAGIVAGVELPGVRIQPIAREIALRTQAIGSQTQGRGLGVAPTHRQSDPADQSAEEQSASVCVSG